MLRRIFETFSVNEKYPLSPNIMFYIAQVYDEIKDRARFIDELIQKFDISKEEAERHLEATETEFAPVYARTA